MKLNFTKNSGIYCFENIVNGKKYIGQAGNLSYRVGHHRSYLRGGYDGCLALQRSWTKYGEENFNIYLVEECPIEELNEKEIFWIKELKTHVTDGGLNISFGGDAFFRGRNHTEESKKKISENSATPTGELNRQFGIPRTEEEKEKISSGLKKFYESHEDSKKGKKQSPETIEKRRLSMTGKKHSEESKRKMSESNSGKKRTDEQKKAQSERKKGTKHTEETKTKMSLAKKGRPAHNKGKKAKEGVGEKISKKLSGVKRFSDASSRYVGVSLVKSGRWCSYINKSGKKYCLGTYDTEQQAALAYNDMAVKLYGENAKLNIIEQEADADGIQILSGRDSNTSDLC